jgi:hypothetical protein
MRDLPEILVDESAKEVFFYMGITLFAAQSFEESLLGMLVGLYITENPNDWKKNYEKETESLRLLPLGRLLDRARKIIIIDKEVDSILSFALKQRNRFVHHFYSDSFSMLTDKRGHKKIIDELVAIRELFTKADNIIEPLSYQLMLKAGMTEEQISKYAHQVVESQLRENEIID